MLSDYSDRWENAGDEKISTHRAIISKSCSNNNDGDRGRCIKSKVKKGLSSNRIYFLMTTMNALLLLATVTCLHFLFIPTAVIGAVIDPGNVRNHEAGKWENSDTSATIGSEKWRLAKVHFLTKVKWRSENGTGDFGIAANDYHVIELHPENATFDGSSSGSENLRIHLSRKSSVSHPKLKVVVQDGEKREDWMPPNNDKTNCHFIGHVTSASPQNGKAEVKDNQDSGSNGGGLAVLSACDPNNGFSGLIIMEDGRQFYIEPFQNQEMHTRGKREANPYTRRETLEHIFLPHSELAGHLAAHISDVLRVPLPQLEEAARLAALDAEARRHSSLRYVSSVAQPSARDWDDDDDAFEILQGESSILTPFFYNGAMLPFIGRPDRSKANPTRKVTSRKGPSNAQSTLLTPLDTTTTSVSSSTSVSSLTSSTSVASGSIENGPPTTKPQPRVVEIAVFTDEELYNKMKLKMTLDTTTQLKEYATAMVNMMDVMYQHSSLGVRLRFKLVYLEVMKRRPNSLKTNGGRAKAYLSSFCDYAGEKNANSAQWDHALLLTGVDLHEGGVKTTAGLAWAGTMCFRYYSCSISEGLNFASAYITTHEIGHSLGMEHDGVGISESCNSTMYIMSPTTGPGKVTWSKCSSSNLQDFIKYGTSELRGKSRSSNMISRPICLEEMVSSRNKKSFELKPIEAESDLKLPGEKYDANFQCSLGMGSFFKPHFERHKAPFDNICWILYCGNGTHAISTHPALEGTPCDRKKYCRAGQCVKRPEVT